MIKSNEFKTWLESNTRYSDAVIGDILSRMKRADGILCWEKEQQFEALSVSVRSQIRKAVKLYTEYLKDTH